MFFPLYLLVLSLTAKEALCTANVGIVLSSASGNATVHSTVLLVCVAGGNFTPEVTWHFSGSLIQSNVSTKHAIYNTPLNLTTGLNFVESILEICDIGLADEGDYTCNASAEGASSNTTTTVTVQPPMWQVNITGERSVNETDTLELTCTSSRLATLSWFRKENSSRLGLTKIVPTLRISIIPGNVEGSSVVYSVLTITSVLVSDNNTFVCEAQDDDGFSSRVDHSVQVNAKNECQNPRTCQNGHCTDLERGYFCTCDEGYTGTNCEMEVASQPASAPMIIKAPASITLTESDIATPINLTCMATGHPPPTYQWLKDGIPIPQEFHSYLYIAELLPEDRGNYTCMVNNSEGDASEQANVDIQGILQYTAQLNFSTPVDVDQLLATIINSNLSISSVYAVEVLNQIPQRQMFELLITLVNVPSSMERSAVLDAIESSLMTALRNLEIQEIQPIMTQIDLGRYDGCDPEVLNGHQWSETAPGYTEIGPPCPCTEAEGQLAARETRRCVGTYSSGSRWDAVDDSHCRDRLSGKLCVIFENLNLTDIANASITKQVDISQTLNNITSNPENLIAADVSTSAAILSQLTVGATMNATLRDNYLQIIDNIQQVNPEEVLTSQTETGSSQMVLESLQQFQDAYLASNASDQDNKTVFTFNTFAIQIQEIDTTDGFGGQSFSVNLGSVEDTTGINGTIPREDLVTSDSAMDVSTMSTASIQLPNNLFESCGLSDKQTRLSYSVFLSDVLFQNETQIRDGLRVGSIILAPRLPCSKTLITPITVSFRTNQMIEANASNRSCGLWSTDRSAAWLLDICEGFAPIKPSPGSESGQGGGGYTANYRHLAHFGILFDLSQNRHEPIPHEEAIALQVISYVGLVTSLFCLTIFLVSYFSTKKLRTSIHGQILINMCLALMAFYIFFLLSGHVNHITILCGVSAALMQYFILAFFGWTLVEVVWLYLKLVKVFGVQAFTSMFMLKAGIPTWAVPFLIVGITAGPGHRHYYTLPYCIAKEWPFYAGTIVPFLLVYIVNWIMFVIIMASICKHTRGADHKKGHKVDTIKKNIVIALTLATIFGLGWGIGFAATSGPIRQLTFAFQIAFSVLVGLQGTLIFVLHGIRNKDVRMLWKQCFARIGGKYIISSIFSTTKSSSAGPQSLHGANSASGTMSLSQRKPLDDDKEHIMYDTVAGEESKSDNGHVTTITFTGKGGSENLYSTVAGEETKYDLAL